jgi:hypothetical protein
VLLAGLAVSVLPIPCILMRIGPNCRKQREPRVRIDVLEGQVN